MTTEFAAYGALAILLVGSFLLLLCLIAAPLEFAARRSPRFAAWVDRTIERVFR